MYTIQTGWIYVKKNRCILLLVSYMHLPKQVNVMSI